tara:strand:- start:2786 stop:3403 length:618 start_codon:yes stop_codon:yes gene_type:complete
MILLPKDLNSALSDMEKSALSNLNSQDFRFTIEIRFEGLKFNRIGFKLYDFLSEQNNTFLTFSDPGAVALAQRDYKEIKNKIFTFKSFNDSPHISNNDSNLISMLPQPYDFDSFEPMCENYNGKHFSINPKFEDANIGIGSVIRERRKNFVKTWVNSYFLQPLNGGALMHIFPHKWMLFKERENKYIFVKEFETKPDNETIFINL